ncbi:hypothetical protein NQ317_006722 [Molorchus minor]|uniref:Protein SON n=1 Tax=Molorchus minor TaxID=1323400 RepID=A0ABQ9K2W3_9CUCU|nr:hypothetical protein NQ317_006722 [Molorchus minor]
MSSENEEKKPDIPTKSSMEILSELFSTFHADPPLIIKKEKSEESGKKHKKKKKKKKSSSSSSDESEIDLAEILIKQEKGLSEKKLKIEGTDLALDINLKKEQGHLTKTKTELKTEDDNNEHKEHSKKISEKKKIVIKDLKLSSIFDSTIKQIQEKKRHSRNEHNKDKDDFYRGTHRSRSSGEHHSREADRTRDKHRENRSKERYKDEFSRELDDYKRNRHRDNSFYKDDGFYRSRDRARDDRDDSWFRKKLLEIARKNAITMMKSGSLPGALTLGPQAQEKVIAAIKSGGKTIEELTDFCKTLSKKEELGELSSLSEKDDSDSETDKPFHHPFQIKDRPTTITMNIKFPVSSGQQHRKGEEWHPVSPPPTKKAKESVKIVVDNTIPTSNIPLPIGAPPETEQSPAVATVPVVTAVIPEPITVPAPPNAPPGPQVFPTPVLEQSSLDIGSIVSQRLTAMRKLQENPHDVQALSEMYKSNKKMQSWACSKQQLGQFTGSTGAQILSQAELASGYQAWAKKGISNSKAGTFGGCTERNVGGLLKVFYWLPSKQFVKTPLKHAIRRAVKIDRLNICKPVEDQLQTAAPVSGGMGMHLLQKMGWKPGEGLGKEKTGTLEPLLLEVKLDKKGLVANEEQRGKARKQKGLQNNVKNLQGKHPVSLLGEYASKKKLGAPQYILEFECGPDHKKNFLFKVLLNGVEYKPNVTSCNKKEAKAAAAKLCLQQIGLLSG